MVASVRGWRAGLACLPQAEALDPAAAARIWEGQLAGALLAEDGGLALSHLATTAAHGFMPKIQTQGQLGHAHWRLVSAPSIPGERRTLLACRRSCLSPHVKQLYCLCVMS